MRTPRAAFYPAGLAALVAALVVPAGSIEAHVATHALIAVVAAPLLVLAAPLALVLGPFSPERRRRALALLGRPPLAWLALPVVCWAAFVGAHWIAHSPAVLEGSGVVHVGAHALLLITAVAFWLPVIGRGPVPRPLRGGAASLYLFLAMPATDLVAAWLIARGEPAAAGVMLAAMAPLGVAALWVTWSWISREERLARLSEAPR
jgi:putative membrane protein